MDVPASGNIGKVPMAVGVFVSLPTINAWTQREAIVDMRDQLVCWNCGPDPAENFLRIECPCQCGAVVVYPTVDDVPLEDVPCPNGTPWAWILKHETCAPWD
jgi:hypothetical protein